MPQSAFDNVPNDAAPNPLVANPNPDAALINRLAVPQAADLAPKSQAPEKAPEQAQPMSYLEKGADLVTSTFIKDDSLRHSVDHYASEFIKTASLFTGGKAGLIGTAITYGLGSASPETSLKQQVEDFGLGAAKGTAMKGIFHVVGERATFAPTKGVLIGIGNRAADDVFQRDLLTDPSKSVERMSKNLLDPKAMAFDAVTWGAAEGAFGAVNAATKGALVKSALGTSIAKGASFGLVTGGGAEIVRQNDAGEKFDFLKVAKAATIEGLVTGAAGGVGGKLTPIESKVATAKGDDTSGERRVRSNVVIPAESLSDLNTHSPVRQQQRSQAQIAETESPVGQQHSQAQVVEAEAPVRRQQQRPQAQVASFEPLEQQQQHSQAQVANFQPGEQANPLVQPAKAEGISAGAAILAEQTGGLKASDALLEEATQKPNASNAILDEAGKADGKVKATVLPEEVDTTPYADVRSVEVDPLPPQTVPTPKEYVMTGGKEALDAFRLSKSESAMVKVREILGGTKENPTLGPEKSLFVQQLIRTEGKLLADADKADLIATAYPETLPDTDRAKHIFSTPDVRGKIFLLTDNNNHLLFANGAQPQEVKMWRDNGFTSVTRLDGGQTNFNVMAPLMIGDPKAMDSPQSQQAWAEFDRQLAEAKKLGIDSVSTDIWWGMIEPEKGKFNFDYADKLSDHIIKAGLRWNPILSFHECGGNVGDTVNVPLPEWVWKDLASKLPGGTEEAFRYKSEQGNTSKEYISLWADDLALDNYKSVMQNFQDHFADKRKNIGEVNISLGPAGELRFPSYNGHDQNTGYPTRGGLQAYSDMAISSFRDYVKAKYGGEEALGKAWGIENLDDSHILPPSDATGFFNRGDHFNTQYGRDFFDWYNQSLIDHGQRMMTLAASVFASKDAPFNGVDLGAKVPGVHWRAGDIRSDGSVQLGDRQAELAAGLIRTSRGDWDRDADGRGYRPLLTMFRKIQPTLHGSDSTIVPAFTAIELRDGDNGPAIRALPHTLATWFGQEAERQGVWLKGENALNGSLFDGGAWDNMSSLLDLPKQEGYFHGVTLLRMGDVVNNPTARAKLSELVNNVHSIQNEPTWWQNFFRTKTSD